MKNWLQALAESGNFIAYIGPSGKWFNDARCQLQYEEARRMKLKIFVIAHQRVEFPKDFYFDEVFRFSSEDDLRFIVPKLVADIKGRE